MKEVKDLEPGVAIVDLRLESFHGNDISGAALSRRIKDVCSNCCIILVSAYFAEAPKLLDKVDLFRFRIDRSQLDFWAELPKRFSDAVIHHANALAFDRLVEAPHDRGQRGTGTPSHEVYISYAWDDVGDTSSSREEIVNRIERCLLKNGYDVRREKRKLGYGELISVFMKEMGSGGCVIAVLSDKYLRSQFCMYELLEVYRNHNFHNRLCPVFLADAEDVKDHMHRLAYIKYWANKYREYAEEYNSLPRDFLSPQDVEEHHRYWEISHEVGKLLSFIADMVHIPPGQLEKDDFAILRGRIDECLMQCVH